MLKRLLVVFALFIVVACNKIVAFDVIQNDNAYSNADSLANEWIYYTMKDYYLWADQMPDIANTNLNDKPTHYFYTILNKYDTIDRFSWIDSSASNLTNQLNGINTVFGIKYIPFYADLNDINVVFSIAYVLKGSPAAQQGLKRGDIIAKVDGVNITINNYTTILQKETVSVELATFSNNVFTNSGITKTITRAQLQTNPILKDSILELGGKRIGYLAYIQFLTSFDNDLRTIFNKFKNNKPIDELVLDLRYNGGGYVTSSDLLTNLIVPDLPSKANNSAIFMNKKIYNSKYTAVLEQKNDPSNFITNFSNEAANLGNLKRLFVLTSNNTASASELIINNLKPFMEVILIGEHTYGKNVGSFTITDSKKRWSFGLQPITFMTVNFNGVSDYGTVDGFTPTYLVEDNLLPYKELGDPTETYLGKAISIISPVAYKTAGIGNILKTKKEQVQSMPLSDNQKMDRKEMWIDVKK